MTTMADLGGAVVRGSHVDCSNLTLRSSPQGQTEPPSFVAATAELASIADAGEAMRPPTVRPRLSRRRVLPGNRPPWRAEVAPAPGQ
jgi:hypothetical protein